MGRAWITCLLALLVSAFWSGCKPEMQAGSSGAIVTPKRLRIGFVPQQDLEVRAVNAYEALRGYLTRELGIPVESNRMDSVSVALEGIRSNKLDLCSFSPWPFFIAESKAEVEALAFTQGPHGGPASYHTVLITRPDTGLNSFEDVKARSRELVFSFEEAVSTSGHLVPRTFFHRNGIDPTTAFKQMLFSPDSTVSILAVKAGRLDLAAVSETGLAKCLRHGRIAEGDIKVIWKSDPVLATIVSIRRDLPPEFKERIRTLLVEMPTRDPAAWAEVAKVYSNPVIGYLPPDQALLETYRSSLRTVPGLQLAL